MEYMLYILSNEYIILREFISFSYAKKNFDIYYNVQMNFFPKNKSRNYVSWNISQISIFVNFFSQNHLKRKQKYFDEFGA